MFSFVTEKDRNMETSANDLIDFAKVHSLEYVEANGLGGYASGTFSGAHSRKYHGLLVASLQPPIERHVLVSKIDESLLIDGEYFHLGCNQFPGTLYPFGVQYLTSYGRGLFPEWTYKVKGVTVKKSIAAVYGENTTLVLYEVLDANEKFSIDFQPFYSCRDFHCLTHQNEFIGRPYIFEKGIFRTMNYQGSPEFFMSIPKSVFTENQTWYQRFEFSEEQKRGMEFCEDLYTHGKFTVQARKGSKIGIIVSLTNPASRDAVKLFREERNRREDLIKNFSDIEPMRRLALAADQFVVKRDDMNTIIAGYPWFSDWGRDTMISLTGLCLVTGRFKDAKRILQKFSEYENEGMIPNRFPDSGELPEYNTIDATLWFFHAVYKYYQYSHDKLFIRNILPVLRDVIEWHYRGTRYHIKVDPQDDLLSGGEEGVQLTWMDAKVNQWVVTPRRGKAVEVNALWYNALCIMEHLLLQLNYQGDAEFFNLKAKNVKQHFNDLFWNEKDECLYDYVDGDYFSADIRPNQLYALGLPFKVLDQKKFSSVIDVVRKHLLTSRGLRSLSPLHSDYRGTYQGDLVYRDGAYHQGTVWAYLSGIYIDAIFAAEGNDAKDEAIMIVKGFFKHLDEAGMGTVSEIFDGHPPHKADGCFAQAWSVAELIRVAAEYNLVEMKKKHATALIPAEALK
jgi:predicted glycogen debranching enzyme